MNQLQQVIEDTGNPQTTSTAPRIIPKFDIIKF